MSNSPPRVYPALWGVTSKFSYLRSYQYLPLFATEMGTPKRASPVQDWEKNYKVKLIVKEEWDEQRDIFTRLYITEGRKLADVRRIMAEQHGFYAKYVYHNRLHVSI